ncbi:alpha-glucan family phosphorylase [Paenibacillus humicola]|uniref:alpha-glucan family phosphorylase n=1 Tax=Paenibacillus humicola TaxID=3110540 RepID=UPI00237AD4B4|nr:alpha-glucan family phosphorylase [Paenibacillus humicola]
MCTCAAYFSAEFGLDESLPIYSGGLGILAGDHMKAAGDLGLPLVGVGIFYSCGYFEQRISESGTQEHLYPMLDPDRLPLEPVLDAGGRQLLVTVPLEGREVYLKALVARAGSAPVYLLSADTELNGEHDRRLTDRLYPGDPAVRIGQEIILGIGGVRLLAALGIVPGVWHMNEGHSAFLTLERIRMLSAEGVPFETALEAVKAATVFTTHTPVPAGHDIFSEELVDRFLGGYYWQLGTSRERILELGRAEGGFNMTRLAASASAKVNGVSRLHAEVTKKLFHRWMPHIPGEDIPVEAITNGIHTETWLSPEMKALFDRHLPQQWRAKAAKTELWEPIRDIPDRELWEAHEQAKGRMLRELGLPAAGGGRLPLVIGFARRFATYKRALLVFRDPERLARILRDAERPVVLVFAGKAHPADGAGQELIRGLSRLTADERFKDRVFIVPNYAMDIAKRLVQGVDVWLNTPVKPMEASGTSGQKAAVNGVLNLSVLDGWWCEGYNGRNGWAIPGAEELEDDARADQDSRALYELLENEVVPLYYSRGGDDVPGGWTAMMKESIVSLAPQFNTTRMVLDYWRTLYAPVSERGARFAADGFELARKVADYKRFIRSHWREVSVRHMEVASAQGTRIGLPSTVCRVEVVLGPIWHQDIRVEAVGPDGKGGIWKAPLTMVKQLGTGCYLYEGALPGDGALLAGANVRAMPVSPDFAHEFEMELAAWG